MQYRRKNACHLPAGHRVKTPHHAACMHRAITQGTQLSKERHADKELFSDSQVIQVNVAPIRLVLDQVLLST